MHAHTYISKILFHLSLTNGFSKIHTIYSTLQVLYSPQDYRSEGTSASEWRSSTEVLFQPDNPSKVRKFKPASVVSLTLKP